MIIDVRVAIGAALGSHLLRGFWATPSEVVIASELESIRAQLRELAAQAAKSEAEGEVCEWRVWKAELLFRGTVLFDLFLLFVIFVWWFPLRKEGAGAAHQSVEDPAPERELPPREVASTAVGPVTPKRIRGWQQQQ